MSQARKGNTMDRRALLKTAAVTAWNVSRIVL